MGEALEEIANERENLMRQVAKAETDAAMWRQKYETEAVAKAEELEMTKMKLMARLTEAESMIENLNSKLHQVEKSKAKVDSLTRDLDNSQKETRNASSDLFKVKSAYEETVLQLDEVRRENKALSNEIKDIMDQISE